MRLTKNTLKPILGISSLSLIVLIAYTNQFIFLKEVFISSSIFILAFVGKIEENAHHSLKKKKRKTRKIHQESHELRVLKTAGKGF